MASTKERTKVVLMSSELQANMAAFLEKKHDDPPVQMTEIRTQTPKMKFSLSGASSTTTNGNGAEKKPVEESSAGIVDEDVVMGDAPPIVETAPETNGKPHDPEDGEIVEEKKPAVPEASKKPTLAPTSPPKTGGKRPQVAETPAPASKKSKNGKKAPKYLDLDAEANVSDEDEKSDDEHTSDREFIAGDEHISEEPVRTDPFREMDRVKEEKDVRKLQRLGKQYEAGNAGTKSTKRLLKSAVGLKGATTDKTYKTLPTGDGDDMEVDHDAEELLKDNEFNKMYGDDAAESDEEAEVAREEKKYLEAKAGGKASKIEGLSSSSDSSSDDSDSDEGEEANENGEEDEAAPQPSLMDMMEISGEKKQLAKGKVGTIDLADDEGSEDVVNIKPAPKKGAASATTPAPISTVSVNTPAVVDRRKICEDQVPKILKLLIGKHLRASTISPRLINGMTSATYLAIASGLVDHRVTNKTSDNYTKIEGILTAYEDPVQKRIDALCVQSATKDSTNLACISPLLPLVLATGLMQVRVVSAVTAAKDFVCPFSKKPVKAGEACNLVQILFPQLKMVNGKPAPPRILFIGTATEFVPAVTKSPPPSPIDPSKQRKKAAPATSAPPAIAEKPAGKSKKESPRKVEKVDAMEIDEEDLNAKEEADDDAAVQSIAQVIAAATNATTFFVPNDDGEPEEVDEDLMVVDKIVEPTDPKERLLQGFDGIFILDPKGFVHLVNLVREYRDKQRKFVEWRPKEKSKPLALFNPETDMPKMELPWVHMTVVGLLDHLFKIAVVEKDGSALRCGDSAFYVNAKYKSSIKEVLDAASEVNFDFLLRLLHLVPEYRAKVVPTFVNPGVLVVKKETKLDDEEVRACFLKHTMEGKPIPNQYDVGRWRFVSRLWAQLFIKEVLIES